MILKRPDERTLTALRRLRSDSDFHEIMAWLQAGQVEIDEKLRTLTDGASLHQYQGAAQFLSLFVQYAQNGIVPAIAKREMGTR